LLCVFRTLGWIAVCPGKKVLVHVEKAGELGYRIGMIFHAQVDVTVVAAVAGFVADDKNGGRLLAAFVAAGRVTRFLCGKSSQSASSLSSVLRASSNAAAIFFTTSSPANRLPCTVY
jgi:hypothetical protein